MIAVLVHVMEHVTVRGWGSVTGGPQFAHVQCGEGDSRGFPWERPALNLGSRASWLLLVKVSWLKAMHTSIY